MTVSSHRNASGTVHVVVAVDVRRPVAAAETARVVGIVVGIVIIAGIAVEAQQKPQRQSFAISSPRDGHINPNTNISARTIGDSVYNITKALHGDKHIKRAHKHAYTEQYTQKTGKQWLTRPTIVGFRTARIRLRMPPAAKRA